MLVNTAGRNLIMPGRSNIKCLINKNEKRKEIVISTRSQQKMIQRGAYLFLKNRSSIRAFWGQILKSIRIISTDKCLIFLKLIFQGKFKKTRNIPKFYIGKP
jgi:hypothetical protein